MSTKYYFYRSESLFLSLDFKNPCPDKNDSSDFGLPFLINGQMFNNFCNAATESIRQAPYHNHTYMYVYVRMYTCKTKMLFELFNEIVKHRA